MKDRSLNNVNAVVVYVYIYIDLLLKCQQISTHYHTFYSLLFFNHLK